MGNLGGEGEGKHLNLEKYEIIEASLDSNPHARLIPKHGGRWVIPAPLCSRGISFDTEGSVLPVPVSVTQASTSAGHPFLLRKGFWHLTNIFLLF